jgi:hypothetical protein
VNLSIRTSLVAVAAAAALLGSLVPQGAPPARADDTVTTARATEFVPATTGGAPVRPSAQRLDRTRVTVPQDLERPGSTGPTLPRIVPDGSSGNLQVAAEGDEGASAMTYDWDGFADEYGPRTTLAVLGSRSVSAGRQGLRFTRTDDNFSLIDYTDGTRGFFGVPNNEWVWGPSVVASIKQGRFVAVLPSYQGQARDCAKGYLNVAVSKTSNPLGTWARYRIAMTDAWTDEVRIGFSDDKVVLATNEWDLAPGRADCLGSAYEGARLRVMDWVDLLNGGALTVKDVSPTPRTSYWSWVPAAPVPGTTSTSTGNTIRLVGDRKVTYWGHVAYATITGSARAGTARLATNIDLTAKRGLLELIGPPETILAMASGNGGLDEAVMSAAVRGSRLYFTSHMTCKTAADIDWRSCARVTELNISTTTPTVVQDVWYVEMEADTFQPVVGIARAGTVFVVMSRSSALAPEPTDHYVAYAQPGELFISTPVEQLFDKGTLRPTVGTGLQGSVVPDPDNGHRVVAEYGQIADWGPSSRPTAFMGNLTGAPGGTFKVGPGTGWFVNQSPPVWLTPDPASPIMWARWSATSDVDVDGRLVNGAEAPSVPAISADFASPSLGGVPADPYPVFVQWRTGDGRWSAPVGTTIAIDTVMPTAPTPVVRFSTGALGTTFPVRLDWLPATDDESGVRQLRISRYDSYGEPIDQRVIAADATSAVMRMRPASPTVFEMVATDLAGNADDAQTPSMTAKLVESTSPALTYSSGWTKILAAKASGKVVHAATRSGARATYAFTGRAVAFVTTKGPKMGKAEVWVDGVLATTLDLRSSSITYRQVAWETAWETPGAHTVVIKVLGTSGRPRVDVDAFLRL